MYHFHNNQSLLSPQPYKVNFLHCTVPPTHYIAVYIATTYVKKFTFDAEMWFLLLVPALPICEQPRPYFGDHDSTCEFTITHFSPLY